MKPQKPVTDGPITKALKEAVDLRRSLIDSGMTAQEADARVGQGLKGVLGNPREIPWRFLCDLCHDTGWIEIQPSREELAKLTAMYGDPSHANSYVNPCGQYCKWTIRERDKRRQKTGDDYGDDDLAAAGQTKKPTRKFTKFGG